MLTSVAGVSASCRRPVSVLVLVYREDNQILLLRRQQPPDLWQSVTGSLQPEESHAEAAARELAEETGIAGEGELTFSGTSRVFTIDPRWRHQYVPGVSENTEYEWHCRLPSEPLVVLNRLEHAEFRWFTLQDAIDTVWSWTNREALKALEDRL